MSTVGYRVVKYQRLSANHIQEMFGLRVVSGDVVGTIDLLASPSLDGLRSQLIDMLSGTNQPVLDDPTERPRR